MQNLLTMVGTLPLASGDGQGLIGTADSKLEAIKGVLQLFGSVLAIALVVGYAISKKTFGAVITAGVMGFVILFLVNGGLEWGRDKLKEEFGIAVGATVITPAVVPPSIVPSTGH
jgi:hypothetical protein